MTTTVQDTFHASAERTDTQGIREKFEELREHASDKARAAVEAHAGTFAAERLIRHTEPGLGPDHGLGGCLCRCEHRRYQEQRETES